MNLTSKKLSICSPDWQPNHSLQSCGNVSSILLPTTHLTSCSSICDFLVWPPRTTKNNLLRVLASSFKLKNHWLFWWIWSFCIWLGMSIRWESTNFFKDWDPQIALDAITTREIVLKNWRTIGRWAFTRSRKDCIKEKYQDNLLKQINSCLASKSKFKSKSPQINEMCFKGYQKS